MSRSFPRSKKLQVSRKIKQTGKVLAVALFTATTEINSSSTETWSLSRWSPTVEVKEVLVKIRLVNSGETTEVWNKRTKVEDLLVDGKAAATFKSSTMVRKMTLWWLTLSSKQIEVLTTRDSSDPAQLEMAASDVDKKVISPENVQTKVTTHHAVHQEVELVTSVVRKVISFAIVQTNQSTVVPVAEVVVTATSANSLVIWLVSVLTQPTTWKTEAATNVNAETTTRTLSEARTKAGTRVRRTSALKTLRDSRRTAGTTKDQTVAGASEGLATN